MTYVTIFSCIIVCINSATLIAYLIMRLLKKPANPQADSRYDRLLATESQEPKEIREYRKKLYFEVGSEILKKKQQIREEVQARAKKTLAEYRKQQEEIALNAEIAKQREKTLSLVNEQIKPRIEYDKKYKTAIAEIILLDDVDMEVKTNGKVQKFQKAGVYKF